MTSHEFVLRPTVLIENYNQIFQILRQQYTRDEDKPCQWIPPGGGLPYETDGDARLLAQGCKFWILVSLRVFRAKRQYFKPPRSRLGFHKELEIYDNAFKHYFQIKAFDDYVFISLKLIACRICVFLSGLFQGSKFA